MNRSWEVKKSRRAVVVKVLAVAKFLIILSYHLIPFSPLPIFSVAKLSTSNVA